MAGSGKAGLALIALAVLGSASAVVAQQDQASPAASETAPQAEVPQRIRVSQGVAKGLRVKMVQPKYPAEARENGIQGTVVLRAVISKAGDVIELSTVSGDPALVKSAVKAVKQWKYRPYLLNGQPVEVDTQILVNFDLLR